MGYAWNSSYPCCYNFRFSTAQITMGMNYINFIFPDNFNIPLDPGHFLKKKLSCTFQYKIQLTSSFPQKSLKKTTNISFRGGLRRHFILKNIPTFHQLDGLNVRRDKFLPDFGRLWSVKQNHRVVKMFVQPSRKLVQHNSHATFGDSGNI